MNNTKLIISTKDWKYITIIGALFGFFISICFYYINPDLQDISTILFCTFTSISISLLSSILISISNNNILPKIDNKYWDFVSFIFAYLSGSIALLASFYIFDYFSTPITNIISKNIYNISIVVGMLTFMVGYMLHLFISMKYKNESIKNEILINQIKAYENELNPHFLFNVLNSISELVYIDKQKAEEAIIRVSKFLRGAITSESLVSLDEEIEMVKNYIDIENIRFSNNIKLSIANIDKMQKQIPKFSIQLLVENSIKHGYEARPIDIEIKIYTNKIIVSNNGKKPKSIKYGTGLTNLDSRLKLLEVGSLKYNIDTKVEFIMEIK